MNAAQSPTPRFRDILRLMVLLFLGTRGRDDFRPGTQLIISAHQLTWGAINTAVGLLCGIFAIVFLKGTVSRWKTVTLIAIPGRRLQAVALGPVVIGIGPLPDDVLDHEMGHWYQSILLGPLYLPVIGLPSVLHALWFQRLSAGARRSDPNAYYRFYTEAWADAWGGSWGVHQHRVKRWWNYLGLR